MFVPSIILSYALIRVLGPNGTVDLLLNAVGLPKIRTPYLTPWGPVIGLVWDNIPITVLILLSGLGAVSNQSIEAARDVGAGRWAVLRHIILPRISNSILVAVSFTVLGIFSAFTLPYVLGPASPEMMGPFMQRTFRDLNDPDHGDHPGGHHLRLLHRVRALLRPLGREEPGRLMRTGERTDWPGVLLAVVLTLVIIFPLFVVAVWSFSNVWRYPSVIPQEFGLKFWHTTLARADVWTSITMSVSLATIVTLISACICLPAAYAFARLDFPFRNLLFFSFLAGHAFPKFGLLVAIAGIFLNLGLIGTFWGVVLIQLVGTLLFMIWIPVAAFQAVDRRMEEIARDVGASPLRVFWSITLPQAGPTIAAALLLSFVSTFYETEGAWLIGAPQIRTMPVLMISFINNQPVIQYGAVLSVLLWIPSFVALMFARRVIGSGSFARGFGADRMHRCLHLLALNTHLCRARTQPVEIW